MKKETTYNYFKKKKLNVNYGKHVVKAGNVVFVCDNANQVDLISKWIKAGGDNFVIK